MTGKEILDTAEVQSTNRTGEAELRFEDSRRRPIKRFRGRIRMVRHELLLGCNAFGIEGIEDKALRRENDFNVWDKGFRRGQAYPELTRTLVAKGSPLWALGIQSHMHKELWPIECAVLLRGPYGRWQDGVRGPGEGHIRVWKGTGRDR